MLAVALFLCSPQFQIVVHLRRRRSWMERTATSVKAVRVNREPPEGSDCTVFLQLSTCSSCASSLIGLPSLCNGLHSTCNILDCTFASKYILLLNVTSHCAFDSFILVHDLCRTTSCCLLQANRP